MNASELATPSQVRLVERVRAAVNASRYDRSITQIVLDVLEDENVDLRVAPTLDEMKELLAAAHQCRQACEA